MVKKVSDMTRIHRRMTLEQRQKISESMRGKRCSEATRKKISASLRKYWAGLPVDENIENNKDKHGKK